MRNFTMPQRNFRRLNNSDGNTIIGVLCLIAASVAAFQISLSNSMAVNTGIKNSRILSARDALEARIKSYSSMGTTFRSSLHLGLPLTENAELRNCIFGTGPNPCKAGEKTPVTLYYPMYANEGATSANIRRISGRGIGDLSANESAYYDNKGNLCIANDSGSIDINCPFFEVTTTFIATCAAGALSCATAESIAVNYVIKSATTLSGSSAQKLGGFQVAAIKLSAPDVPVLNILPATAGSSATNVTITLLPSTLSLDSIKAALQALGINDKGNLEEYALAFQQSGVNDLSKLEFLLKVGQTDPAWIKLVVDSGITNAVLASELYWSDKPWTPALLAEVAAAVENVKVPEVAYAIAEKMITDPAVATQIASAVSSVKNPDVAAGIIAGGHYTDADKVQKISSAVGQIKAPYAEYLAQAGVTDASIANQIVSIVSVISNPYGTGWIIVGGGGDVAKTQDIVNQSLASASTPETSDTSTTTVSTKPETSSTLPPVEISLMPTCSTCTPVTY